MVLGLLAHWEGRGFERWISRVNYPSSKPHVNTNWGKKGLGDNLKGMFHPVPQQRNA